MALPLRLNRVAIAAQSRCRYGVKAMSLRCNGEAFVRVGALLSRVGVWAWLCAGVRLVRQWLSRICFSRNVAFWFRATPAVILYEYATSVPSSISKQ